MGKLILGVNDLKTKYPLIAEEWDYEENAPIRPEDVTYSSNKKHWWICQKGHHYEASPNSRTRKQSGCKYCANKAVLKGFNDLSHTNPEIATEWDYEKNGSDSPDNYTAGSDKQFYWICNNGHESYLAKIKKRTSGSGCPICGRKQAGKNKTATIIKTKGSLKELYPLLTLEWDYDKNKHKPEEYPAQSAEIAWWKCSCCNHSWKAKIAVRTKLGSGCPRCNHKNKTSFPEQAVFYYIKKIFPDAQNSFTECFDNKMELDVYIPSCSIGIEYDGIYWHGQNREEKDKQKYFLCKKQGITLFRIRESEKDATDICDAYIVRKDYSSSQSLDQAIKDILSLISKKTVDISIDSDRDKAIIIAQYMTSLRENSLLVKYPKIALEWHPQKNGTITPDMITAHSQNIFWWLCPVCGNEYQKRVSDRTNNNVGCNRCSSRRKSKWKQLLNLKPGENDLVTLFPELMKEWDYKQNIHLSPENLTAGSDENVAWRCQKCGNEWLASIYSRTHGSGCPKCGRIKAGESQKKGSIQKYGSLREKFPEIAAQWDYEFNDEVTPDTVSPIDKSQKYHWICHCGTCWTATVYSLTHCKYVGCKKCRYKQIAQYRKEHPENNPFYRKHHTNETKAKLSDALSGENNYWYGKKEKLSPNYGKTFSDEHKAKISKALKGQKKSDETKAKLSASKKGKMMGANNPSSKPVRQLSMTREIIAEYDSIKSAERTLGITAKASKIGAVCQGKRKSAYGFLWEYIK